MRAIWLFLLSLITFGQALAAPDYAREQKWADEILPSVLTGDPVYLAQDDGHKYLNLYAAGESGKIAVVLAHGLGVHPDWGLIGMLRQRLVDAGHATLSVQMPVLAPDAKGEDYMPTFGLAAQRLARSVEWLRDKGYGRIAIVSHSLGGRMVYRYLAGTPSPAVIRWVAISMPGTEDYAALPLAILDLYGANDHMPVIRNASTRAKGLRQAGSGQNRVAGADHFFEGQDDALYGIVRAFLEKT